MRPAEWSKSFGNMAIAAVTAGIVLEAQLSPTRFLIGFASLAMLWSGLYALNDYTDRHADALHPVKKQRAIPSGRVPEKVALVFAFALIFGSLAVAWAIDAGGLFTVCVLAMLANQWLYTMKPFNFKKRPVVDLISGSLINPIFRFYAGWVLFIPMFNAPITVLLFILGIQFGGFGLYRMSSKEHEKKLGLNSSVVLFGEKNLKILAYASLAIGAIMYIASTLPLLGFAVLPVSYFALGLAMLLPLPLYKSALTDPQSIDMSKMYNLIYLHYGAFIIGFILLYFFPIAL